MIREWTRGDYVISTDPHRIDLDLVHRFLAGTSYWAAGRSRVRVARSIEHALAFGLYHRGAQVGFARVVTDWVTLAFLADVFVLDEHRGQGLGTWLVEVVTTLPELQAVRRWMLATRDAHELYRRFGFADVEPSVLMERIEPESEATCY
jgi:GNAT superfamily N-acetyltransferase